MVSLVLRSQRAIHVNISIMWSFVKIRRLLFGHKELKFKIEALEQRNNKPFKKVFSVIKELMETKHSTKKMEMGLRIQPKRE